MLYLPCMNVRYSVFTPYELMYDFVYLVLARKLPMSGATVSHKDRALDKTS